MSSSLLLCEMDTPDELILSHHNCVSEIGIDICAELLSPNRQDGTEIVENVVF